MALELCPLVCRGHGADFAECSEHSKNEDSQVPCLGFGRVGWGRHWRHPPPGTACVLEGAGWGEGRLGRMAVAHGGWAGASGHQAASWACIQRDEGAT